MKKLKFLSVLLMFASGAFGQSKLASASQGKVKEWSFAVSGDSRNCGDVIMPSIADKVTHDGVAFYWHLGDYRAIYDFDQDYKARNPNAPVLQYETGAWPDFIQKQLNAFGDLPVYLGLGNHETISPKSLVEAISQFADWLETPELQSQRLRDQPSDHLVKFYYHWIRGAVDFINLERTSLTRRRRTGYVLASHSHFFMDNVYNTVCRREHPDEVLPGWIV